jgi:hypothetical protein
MTSIYDRMASLYAGGTTYADPVSRQIMTLCVPEDVGLIARCLIRKV